MKRGEVWFAAAPGGDRPVLVLTRDPVADRIGSVVVAALTRTRRMLVSELDLTTADGVPTDCVVNFDNLHTISRDSLRRHVTTLSPARMAEACRTLHAATSCRVT
jgi:mRNA interferase MazF